MKTRLVTASLSGLFTLIAGCVLPLAGEDMVPEAFVLAGCHQALVRVERAPIEYSFRDPMPGAVLQSELQKGVARAVRASGLFAPIDGAPEYRLQVAVFDVSIEAYPRVRQIMVVAAQWRLLRANGEVIYDDIVRTAYVWGAIVGTGKSDKLGAIRENIREGIRRLSLLNLPAKRDTSSPRCG